MPTIYKEVEVEFDLTDLADEELIDELESRHLVPRAYDLIQDLNQQIISLFLNEKKTTKNVEHHKKLKLGNRSMKDTAKLEKRFAKLKK